MSDKFKAWDLFDASLKTSSLEDQLFEEICAILGVPSASATPIEFDDVTYDYYDTSVELKGCDNDLKLSEEQQLKIWDLGYSRCWLCHKNGTETYYSGDPAFAIF